MARRFRHRNTLLVLGGGLATIVLCGLMAIAQRPAISVDDILGAPSNVVAIEAEPLVNHSMDKFNRHEKRYAQTTRHWQALAGSKVVVRSVIRRIVQEITLKFVDEKYHRPIGGLPVKLSILTKIGHGTKFAMTNSMGNVTVSGISPLPAAIDIEVEPGQSNSLSIPAWELANPQMASIPIDRGSGERIAVVAAPPSPYMVASSSYRIPAKRAPAVKYVVYRLDRTVPLVHNYANFAITLPGDAQITYPSLESASPGSAVMSFGTAGPNQFHETQVPLTRVGQTAQFSLPVSILQDGCIPLRISRESDSGDFESIVSSYPDDPYSVNTIVAPPMNLVAIKDVQLPNGVDVLSRASDIDVLFPDLDKHANTTGDDRSQGSDWWKSDYPGVSFRIRKSPFSSDDSEALVECIRLDKADAGSVAGIRVGMPKQDVIATLGDGAETYDSMSYLDGGITFAFDGNTIKSIYIARSRELLEQGTTAFVPRKPAKVFVKSFHVDGQWSRGMAISDVDGLKSYLVRTGVVELVNNEQDADYTLTCEASNFIEKKDVPLGVIPLQYECGMTVTYSLKDNATGQMVYSGKSYSPDENVDFWKLLLPILTGVAVVNKISHSNVANTIADVLGIAFIAALKDAADKADKACPPLVEQEAYSRMADDLYNAFDCRCRVTAIDYNRGLLAMNIGTADGVVAESDSRTTFEILVNTDRGPTPLPSSESGMSADYYLAEVLSAGDHSCTCDLVHVTHSVHIRYGLFGKSYVADNTNVKDDIDMLRRLPDPATGIVSARIKSRLLPLPMASAN